MQYRIGLDIGIGSVGWAVVSAAEEGIHPARIEDFGVRIFHSGEKDKGNGTLCQERRSARGVRRLERRRSFRKKLLLNHFRNIGLAGDRFFDDLASVKDEDVYLLKVRGLDEKLSAAELYKCLVHTCNHRGYRDFYEPDETDGEDGLLASVASSFEDAYRAAAKEGRVRSVSEYILQEYKTGNFVKYRNHKDVTLLIRRGLLQEEAELLLAHQGKFHPQLTPQNQTQAVKIIFRQRDFEDGPGDPQDGSRRYQGFLENLGKCPFYRDQDRGARSTVIADVFAVTDTLSQYRFIDESTGEYVLDKAIAGELVGTLLKNASLSVSDARAILKKHGYKLQKSDNSDDKALSKAVKFLGTAKKCVDEAGMDWEELISEEQFDPDTPSTLHRIGALLSHFQTPSRRREEMKKAGIDPRLIKSFSNKKAGGTASTSYRYMIDAVNAFLNGDIYGNYQANFNRMASIEQAPERFMKLPPSVIEEAEIRDNRVVLKAVNETRKIVNAIIDIYGSPEEIVVEVASELGKSFEARGKLQKEQRTREAENDRIKKAIAGLGIEEAKISQTMIDRYKLYEEQGGRSLYSDVSLGDLKDVLENRDRAYEIDHIVPFSLVLDNTLHNKALVFAGENQEKGQRTPLMYLKLKPEQKKKYLTTVNHMYARKDRQISKKKYAYLKLESIYGKEAEEILSDWKSRNINDTRYITKYIAGILDKRLVFSGEKALHVFPVKGSVTQKFRREWFRNTVWGEEEKNRDTYLNHALDALIAANLTKPYIEIGSDAMKLRGIYRLHRYQKSPEYEEYLDSCVAKMKKYYGFAEAYTRKLLSRPEYVPSYIPDLAGEVKVRFVDGVEDDVFRKGIEAFYGKDALFTVPPHKPVVSLKQARKFRGPIADANPIRVREIDGTPHRIIRLPIEELDRKKLDTLLTDDNRLIDQLRGILDGEEKYETVGKYLTGNGLSAFVSYSGQVIRKVSCLDPRSVSNYYRKELPDGGYTNLSSLKYYCVEVYKDLSGKTRTCGIRFVDLKKKDKKLYRKADSIPEGYGTHVMYLFPNDYIVIKDKGGEVKCSGFYQSVYNINRGIFYFKSINKPAIICKSIALQDKVEKRAVSILGQIGGEVRCSAPLPYIGEKSSR